MVTVKLSSQFPIKLVIMNKHYNTGIEYNSILSGVMVLDQLYQYQVLNMSVSGKLNTESQYHISTRIMMHHVLKVRIAIIRYGTVVTRHSHINISCNKH